MYVCKCKRNKNTWNYLIHKKNLELWLDFRSTMGHCAKSWIHNFQVKLCPKKKGFYYLKNLVTPSLRAATGTSTRRWFICWFIWCRHEHIIVGCLLPLLLLLWSLRCRAFIEGRRWTGWIWSSWEEHEMIGRSLQWLKKKT